MVAMVVVVIVSTDYDAEWSNIGSMYCKRCMSVARVQSNGKVIIRSVICWYL